MDNLDKIEIDGQIDTIFYQPAGVYDITSIKKYIENVRKQDRNVLAFNRFIDLSNLESSEISQQDFEYIASIVKKFRADQPKVKACYYCTDPVIQKITFVFIETIDLMGPNNQVTSSLYEAARFLNIDIQRIKRFRES